MGRGNVDIGGVIANHHRLAVLGLALVIGIILVARCFNAVFHPILFNEDGRDILAWFMNNPDPSSIFRFYAGYVALLPNTIGYIVVRFLPLPMVPYAFVLISLGFAVTALSLFALKRFRFVMPDDASRLAVCLILALFPVGNHPLLTALSFSLWNIFFVALLLTLAPLPRAIPARVAQFLFISLAIWSHPFSVLFIPVTLGLACLRRTRIDRLFQAGIIVMAGAYFLFGVRPGTVRSRLNLDSLVATSEALAHRVVFEPVFGNSSRVALHAAGRDPVIMLGAVVIMAALVTLIVFGWKNTRLENRASLFGFTAFIILALTGISVVARTNMYESFITFTWAQRYFLIQQLLILFLFAIHAIGLVPWARLPRVAKSAVLVVLLAGVLGLNLSNRPYFTTSKEQGDKTLDFLRQAEKRLKWGPVAGAGAQEIVLRRPPEWDIRIDLGDPDAP